MNVCEKFVQSCINILGNTEQVLFLFRFLYTIQGGDRIIWMSSLFR